MSTSFLGSYEPLAHQALPFLSAGFALFSIATGYNSLTDPVAGAKLYGAQTSTSQTSAEETFTRAAGLRNIATGLSLVVLSYYANPDVTISPVAVQAVRKAIGISLLAGTIVGLGDGYLVGQFASGEGAGAEVKKTAEERGAGHTLGGIALAAMGVAFLNL